MRTNPATHGSRRMTMNVDAALLAEAGTTFPGQTATALVEEGLRALLAREAACRLADLGGTMPGLQRAKRAPWRRE